MSDKNKKVDPVPLATMLGQGNRFEAQGKEYEIRPLKLKMVDEFIKDQLSIGPQLFNFISQEAKEKLEKWLPRVIFNKDGKGMTLDDLINDDWDLSDLRRLWRQVLELSG